MTDKDIREALTRLTRRVEILEAQMEQAGPAINAAQMFVPIGPTPRRVELERTMEGLKAFKKSLTEHFAKLDKSSKEDVK